MSITRYKTSIARDSQRQQLIEYMTMCFGDGKTYTTDTMVTELAEDLPAGLDPAIWPRNAIAHALGRVSGRLAGWHPAKIGRNLYGYRYQRLGKE